MQFSLFIDHVKSYGLIAIVLTKGVMWQYDRFKLGEGGWALPEFCY